MLIDLNDKYFITNKIYIIEVICLVNKQSVKVTLLYNNFTKTLINWNVFKFI